MTFHDFNILVPVATVPSHKARLIQDGITRAEYRRRFGMDDASLALFAALEDNAKLLAKMDKAASSDDEFTRFAKISSGNKKKVVDYWVKWLGYPQEYVGLMVKDYEK